MEKAKLRQACSTQAWVHLNAINPPLVQLCVFMCRLSKLESSSFERFQLARADAMNSWEET